MLIKMSSKLLTLIVMIIVKSAEINGRYDINDLRFTPAEQDALEEVKIFIKFFENFVIKIVNPCEFIYYIYFVF